jgi:hypothetical protein
MPIVNRFLSVKDTNGLTSFGQSYIDKVFSAVDTLQVSRLVQLTGNITIPKGKKLKFVGPGQMNLGNASIVCNGEIEARKKIIFLWNGSQADCRITGEPETEEWLSDWFGMVADGVTDWRADGKAYAMMRFSSLTRATVVFTVGLYKTALDNTYSNVTVKSNNGAHFAGTIHAAINNDGILNPQNNPKNVKFLGLTTSLERVGSYFCDDVYFDEILIKSDDANSLSGFSAGVHFYKGSKRVRCPKITIEDSRSSFGFGLDSDDGNLPEDCHFGQVIINKSQVTGFYTRSKNCSFESVLVKNYGLSELVDVENIGLPGFTGDTSKTYGAVYDSCENLRVGTMNVTCNGYGFIASNAIEMRGGTTTTQLLVARGSAAQGLSVATGSHHVESIDARLSKSSGVQVGAFAELTFGKIIASYNKVYGVDTLPNARISGTKVTAEFNEQHNVKGESTSYAVQLIEASESGDGYYNVVMSAPSGFATKINTKRAEQNKGGGLSISGLTSGFEYSAKLVNEGASSAFAHLITDTENITNNKLYISGSTNQALRMTTLSGCSFNNVMIKDSGSGAGILSSGLTNVSFMNSKNEMSTDLAAASVAEFNNSGITQAAV